METHVRQFDHEAVVSDFRSHLRVMRLVFPTDLFSFFQIFKVGRYKVIEETARGTTNSRTAPLQCKGVRHPEATSKLGHS
jgi:hypothetical protein